MSSSYSSGESTSVSESTKGSSSSQEVVVDQKSKTKAARAAHATRDVDASRKAHEARVSPEEHGDAGDYVKSIVFGGLDGIVTTFAVVAGVAGANLSAGLVLVLGFANLIADGLSMGVGEFASGKAEQEYIEAEREREEWEFETAPEGEIKEMVDLYVAKGVTEADATKIMTILSKYDEVFVDLMMVDELGLLKEDGSPWKQGVVMFFSFVLFGSIPLITYIIGIVIDPNSGGADVTFGVACILTGLTLFILGMIKAHITSVTPIYGCDTGCTKPVRASYWHLVKGGFVMLFNGGISALSSYLIGYFLRFLVEDGASSHA